MPPEVTLLEPSDPAPIVVTPEAGIPPLFQVPGHLATVVDAAPAEAEAEAPVAYQAWLIPEGVSTDDGRFMALGSIAARLERLPLMASDRNLPAHLQAEFIGNLVEFSRGVDTDGGQWFISSVDFDTDESALEWQRMVREDRIRGVSVDLQILRARIKTEEGEIVDAFTGEPAEDQSWPDDELVWLVVDEGLIMGATMVPMPAFRNARVEPVTAAAVFDVLPLEWFSRPELDQPVRAQVSVLPNNAGGGPIRGHGAAWGTCLVGHRGCIIPPASELDYALARRIPSPAGLLAPIYWQPNGDLYSHAPLDLEWWDAISWYEQNLRVVGFVQVGEDVHGIWTAGYCSDQLAGRHLSGDWRPYGPEGYEFIGWSIVNSPGFPVPAAIAAAVANRRAIVGSAEPDCGCEDAPALEFSAEVESTGEAWIPDLAALAAAVSALTSRLDVALGRVELEWDRYQARGRSAMALGSLEKPEA